MFAHIITSSSGQLSDREGIIQSELEYFFVLCDMSGCEPGPMVQWPENQLVFCFVRERGDFPPLAESVTSLETRLGPPAQPQ